MNTVKSKVYAAALAGMAAGAIGIAASDPAVAQAPKNEKCWGINTCKAESKCSVSKKEIEATKADFGDKFAKSAVHDCAGDGKCAAAKGELAWIETPAGTCIKDKKGFMIVVKGDKKVVVK